MDDPVSVGVIGAGYAAEQLHWPAFRSFSGIRVLRVADLDRGRAERLTSRLHGAVVAADAASIIADAAVEAVAILTPPETHGSLVAAALEAGKHVLVEKPLTSIPEELDWLVEKTRLSGRVVAVGHNLRCHRFVRQARAVIQNGALGELLAIRTVWTSSPRNVTAGQIALGLNGSVLLDLGVHHIDVLAYLSGNPIETVSGTINHRPRGSESAWMAGRLSGGTLFTSVVSREGISEHRIHVAGTKGAIEFSCYRANSWRARSTADVGLQAQTSEIRQYLRQLPDLFRTIGNGGDWLQSYRTQWRDFASSVRQGTPVACSIEDAARAVRLCAQMEGMALHQTA